MCGILYRKHSISEYFLFQSSVYRGHLYVVEKSYLLTVYIDFPADTLEGIVSVTVNTEETMRNGNIKVTY